ncbi:MAG: extracellular solute-binding protein, partial [Candidatus Pacebacteria bacterium]|nr:extracellular solute-binding protein [Candidatus Paceibacterota bacterium]
MKDMTPFQLILTGIFAAFIVIGVILFALFRGGSSGPVSNITVWGTVTTNQFTQIEDVAGILDDETINIEYVEINEGSFDNDFINALASGEAPDLVFINQDLLVKHRDKLASIPYDAYSERDFRDTFIREGELFLSDSGVLGLPFIVDPLVMYWNRTHFSNAGLSTPPKNWSEFFSLTDAFVIKDEALNVQRASIPFGEYQNVSNAKEIISAIIMQAGSPITERDGSKVRSVLAEKFNQSITPAEAAIKYYTEFSDPVKKFYTWNRSLPDSQDFFVAGNLSVYFGFASEIRDINAKNPNLNFDVAVLPQSKGGNEIITFGKLTALAIPKLSDDRGGALRVASLLTSKDVMTEVSLITELPPVRNDLLKEKSNDPFQDIFYNSAIWARGWLDPDSKKTDLLFKEMIESITSGR